jgi:hypothetical protein
MPARPITLCANMGHVISVFNKYLANLLISIPTMEIHHPMVLTSKSSVLTAEDRTICVSVLSLGTKLLLIGIGLPIIAHLLLDNQLDFAVIINVHGLGC